MWREATLYPADSWDKTVYTNPVFGGYRDFGDTFRARRYLRELAAYYPEVGVSEEIIDVFLATDLTSVVNLRG